MFELHPDSSTPLVNQIIDGLRELIDNQTLKPGAKVPSIRAFAASYSVSTFTVVEAYDRLVAQGLLVSRGNAGFFVNRAAGELLEQHNAEADTSRPTFNSEWYLQQIFEIRQLPYKPGCGWLPNDWMYEDGLRRGLRQVAGSPLELSGYGDPMGLMELRALTAQNLQQELSIVANPAQLMLTHGASQALDLAARTLVRPGDVVLVDDPGYPNLMSIQRVIRPKLTAIMAATRREVTPNFRRIFPIWKFTLASEQLQITDISQLVLPMAHHCNTSFSRLVRTTGLLTGCSKASPAPLCSA